MIDKNTFNSLHTINLNFPNQVSVVYAVDDKVIAGGVDNTAKVYNLTNGTRLHQHQLPSAITTLKADSERVRFDCFFSLDFL